MGNFLAAPALEKDTEGGTGKDFKYACSAMQGWRNSMEDSHIIKVCHLLITSAS